jgi:ribose transport system permease protein
MAANQVTQTPPQATGLRKAGSLASLSRDIYVDLALVVALAILLIVFGAASDGREFLESSILGVIAVGEVIVMISGNLDISVGSGAGLVTATMAEVMAHTHANLLLGIVIAVVTGLAAGLINGAAVSYARVNSVIATLATYSAYLGVALLVTNGQEVGIDSSALGTLGTGSIGSIPYLVIVLVVVTAIAMLLMRHSLGGHRVYAVGGSEQASRLAGIKVQRYLLSVFVLSGLCVAIAGVMLAAQTGTAQPTEGSVGLELTAITAVLLGGTGLNGGTGTVLGAVLGVLVLVGVPSFWQNVATGVVLMIAVLLQDISGHRARLHAMRAARRRAQRAAGASR